MSEPKLISPLLDGFAMGAPISDHDGVMCCPAMRADSDHKYIVKIISIPASQVQLDALLLTGAYSDPADAMDYFKEQADGVEAEAQLLKKLSKLEGYLPYDRWQVEPMDENRLGYNIYLISSYKRSLEKFQRRNTMTHLGTVNLGIDICAALAIARRAGYIYVDLKPTNIFMSGNREYRIGDLGFMELAGLKYASLPAKYRSPYSPPELQDALGTVNTTADTYALGMILYEIYNNGQLPVVDPEDDKPLSAPVNADYEIAEIILTACDPDPKKRYADPMEMGQALVAYMQRNRVADTPNTPPAAEITPDAEEAPILEKNGNVYDESAPSEADAQDVTVEEVSQEAGEMLDQAEQLMAEPEPDEAETADAETEAEVQSEAVEEAEPVAEAQQEVLDPPTDPQAVENAFVEAAAEEEMDSEAFLSMGDPVVEEPPAPPVEKKKTKNSNKKKSKKKKKKKKKKKSKTGPILLVVLLLLGILGFGGYYYYDNYYLQTINAIQVEGSGDQMTVILDTDTDNSLLTVIATDTYGNNKQAAVSDNKASFSGLLPDTLYKIRVEISGFHALHPKGVASHGYTTDAQTKIASFNAKTGAEDGSVVLNFAVDGPSAESWIVTYNTEGEEERSMEFSGHMVTISGLTVGKTYTFTLAPATSLELVGENSTQFTAASVIMAQNLQIADYTDGVLTAKWSIQEGITVDSWTVRCFSESGFDQTITTADTSVVFQDLDTSKSYSLEVTAAGMTHPARLSITGDPYTVDNLQVDTSDETKLTLTWDSIGDEPEEGWVLKYSIDGSANQNVVSCTGNTAVVQPRIPGATYVFSVESSDEHSVFGGVLSFDCPNAKVFNNPELNVTDTVINNQLVINMLATPDDPNWSYQTHGKNAFTSTFTSGQKASLLLRLNADFYVKSMETTVLYVIRNDKGDVMQDQISQETLDWQNMWDGADHHYCELNIPSIPTTPGKYSLCLYFNGGAITIVEFTVK